MIKIKRKIKWLHGYIVTLLHCCMATLLVIVLVYTRFVGLNWGLPYPMHPDERNMAVAVQQLDCKFSIHQLADCFNPHFFAYGQFPLYLGYLLIWIFKGFPSFGRFNLNFEEAVMSLRIISATASVINVFILVKIVELLILNLRSQNSNLKSKIYKSLLTNNWLLISFLLFTFSPFFIQFSHFGTTESLLMLFYSLIIYYSLKLSESKILNVKYLILSSLFSGLAIATKISSVIFLITPLTVLILKLFNKKNWQIFLPYLVVFITLVMIFSLVFSPHNLISYQDFISAIRYESDVALGRVMVFYTRQFFETIPIWFQLTKIFPYALGWPVFILSLLGFFLLNWKDKRINLLRFGFLIYFLPTSFLFTKWTRFMAPAFPLMLIFSVLFILSFKERLLSVIWRISNIKYKILNIHIKNKNIFVFGLNFLFFIFYFLFLLPGIAYLSIYQNSDVRFQASQWIYKNIPNGAYILSETANVVDIPLPVQSSKFEIQNYQIISFNFYDLDENPLLQDELKCRLSRTDYIFVPSRRIFMNHWCNIKYQITNSKNTYQISKILETTRCKNLEKKYPLLNDYYQKLFSGQLGFAKVAEFNSFPKICFPLTNKCLVFNDEEAEETWTVFDHPVIRIYKRSQNSKLKT